MLDEIKGRLGSTYNFVLLTKAATNVDQFQKIHQQIYHDSGKPKVQVNGLWDNRLPTRRRKSKQVRWRKSGRIS
jgi:hypothetical protein